jgi:uncharacterized protein YuzE
MKLTFDPEHGIGYLLLSSVEEPLRTVSVGENFNVDVTDFGTVVGIEFLDVNRQLGKTLTIENQSTGEFIEIRLPGV